MVSSSLVGRLRRMGIWHVAQKLHRLVAPPVCAVVHHVVQALGSDNVPLDLALKHHFDYVPILVDPRAVSGFVPIRAGLAPRRDGPLGFLDSYGMWRNLGGGWKSTRQHVTRNIAGRFIADGDWDRSVRPFEPLPSVIKLALEGARPEDTVEYQNLVSKVERNDPTLTRGFRSVQEVDDYFADQIRAYEDIRTNGYRSQLELGKDGDDEIRVCIDRDGQLSVFGGGTHRLSIAVLLRVERVPVLIKRVHAQWVAECVRRHSGPVESAIVKGVAALANTTIPDEIREKNVRDESGSAP